MKLRFGDTEFDVMPPVKRYMIAIERRLHTDRATRLRIMAELAGDFQARREAGQTDDAIMADMGTPEAVAAEFNASLGMPDTPPVSRWRWGFAALAAVLLLAHLPVPSMQTWLQELAQRLLPMRYGVSLLVQNGTDASAGVIGGADGPTAIYVTTGGMAGLLSVLPYLLACLAAFLLLGWCRRGGARRCWVPILLCVAGIVPLGVLAVQGAISILRFWTGYELLYSLRVLFANYLIGSGVWLCVLVLIWSAVTLRRAKKHE